MPTLSKCAYSWGGRRMNELHKKCELLAASKRSACVCKSTLFFPLYSSVVSMTSDFFNFANNT